MTAKFANQLDVSRSILFLPASILCLLLLMTRPLHADRSPLEFVQTYCADCHSPEDPAGGFDISAFPFELQQSENFQSWVKIHDRISRGEMPPADAEQPTDQQKKNLLETVSEQLILADRARQKVLGRVVMRRLNRTEFQNSLSRLLSTPLHIEEMLPPDATRHGFDTVGEALNVSSVQLESYLDAIDAGFESASRFYEQPERKVRRISYLHNMSTMQVYRKGQGAFVETDGLAMFATEKMSHLHTVLDHYAVPCDGRYKVKVSAYAIRTPEPITLTVRVGGAGHKESLAVPHMLLKNATVTAGPPQLIEWEGWLQRGHFFHVYPSLRPMRFIKEMNQDQYQGPAVIVQWVEIDGPIFDSWPPAGHRQLWGDLPLQKIPESEPNTELNAQLDQPPQQQVVLRFPIKGKKDSKGRLLHRYEERPEEFVYRQVGQPGPVNRTLELAPRDPSAAARKLILQFHRSAARGPVALSQSEPYLKLAENCLQQGMEFEEVIKAVYKAILVSPDFLYFRHNSEEFDSFSLAERLAFFLTRQPADDELLSLAESGLLNDPNILRQQTERLLNSPACEQFLRDLANQWLDLKLINFTSPDSDLYPDFDPVLQWSMVEETNAYLREMLEKDLSIEQMVDSRFAMVNSHLAKLYEIPGVTGAEIRRVNLPAENMRGGLLTQASILKVTANGTTTSPVVRGKWVLERILGTPAPPPPPGVPAIEPDIRGATTVIEQLEAHRNVASCAVCHVKIDPPGVALECFDVMGGYRTRYRALDPDKADVKVRYSPEAPPERKYIDALPVVHADRLETGEEFQSIIEFKQILARRPQQLANNVVEKLILFSTGGEISFADRQEVAEILQRAETNQYGLRTLIHEIVQSPLFLKP